MSEIKEARLQKASSLINKGFASYAQSFKVSHTTSFLIQKFDYLEMVKRKTSVFLLLVEFWQKG